MIYYNKIYRGIFQPQKHVNVRMKAQCLSPAHGMGAGGLGAVTGGQKVSM